MCAKACSGLPSTEKGLVITVLFAGGVSGELFEFWLLFEELGGAGLINDCPLVTTACPSDVLIMGTGLARFGGGGGGGGNIPG